MSGLRSQPRRGAQRLLQNRWTSAVPDIQRPGTLASAFLEKATAANPSSGVSAASGHAWVRFYQRCLRTSDLSVIFGTMVVSYWLWLEGAPSIGWNKPDADSLRFVLGLMILWPIALAWYRTRETTVLGVGPDEYKRVLAATVHVFGVTAIIALATGADSSAAIFALALPIGALALPASRWTWRRWINRQRLKGHYLSKAVVLGEPNEVRYVIRQMALKSGALFDILGVVVPDASTEKFGVDSDDFRVLGGLDDVVPVVKQTGATAVIVAGPLPGGNTAVRELGWTLEEYGAQLVLASGLTNVAGPRMHLRQIEGLPLMQVDLPRYTGWKHLLKRTMDVVLASLALLVLAPVFLALAAVIRFDTAGPVFFRQERVGLNGTRFDMIKFRSMVVSAEQELAGLLAQNQGAGVLFKMHNDPRVTRSGRWLRRYSLDELPQFWNVLRGDMSLVGPRPPLPREVEGYEGQATRRLLTKPGITGLWQVSGRSDLEWDDAIRLDLYYVENWSLLGDFLILWRTFKVMIHPEGAY